MSDLRQTAHIEVAATPEQVWDAITNPEQTRRYYFGTAVESEWAVGSEVVYRGPGGQPALRGKVLEIEPPRRLRIECTLLVTPATSGDPPHRITWEVEPAGQRTLVRVTCDGYPGENATSRLNASSLDGILRGVAAVVDAELGGQLRRLDSIGAPLLRELAPERADELLAFFDRDGFLDNPTWASCYCMAHHFSGDAEAWARRTADENRSDQAARIRAGARGVLAYVDGRVVGWCNACPRTELLRFDADPELVAPDAERVGSVHCFVISPRYRRHGVARLLLSAACDYLAGLGLEVAEGYPARVSDSDARAYRGTVPMFQAAGFQAYRELPRILVMRRPLRA